jgi:hypothetical protein
VPGPPKGSPARITRVAGLVQLFRCFDEDAAITEVDTTADRFVKESLGREGAGWSIKLPSM